jgi:maltose O-acetyltransferase
MKNFVNRLANSVYTLSVMIKNRASIYKFSKYSEIHNSVSLGADVKLIGPIESFIIGEMTYINDAILSAGHHSKIKIGKQCAIGYRVSIKAITHESVSPYPDSHGNIKTIEKDIRIGDFCWIGDNVFIREGVTLGDNTIVGANSVVTKSFPQNVVIAGIPARIISNREPIQP